MANGIILCALGPAGGYNGPTGFYEYDYNANAFTQVNAPGGGSTPCPGAGGQRGGGIAQEWMSWGQVGRLLRERT